MDILAKSEYNRPDPGIKNPNNQIRYNFNLLTKPYSNIFEYD